MVLSSEIIENRTAGMVTKNIVAIEPYANETMVIARDNINATINLDLDGMSKTLANSGYRFGGLFMLRNKKCKFNVKSKNIGYHDISVYDGNTDNLIYLYTKNCRGEPSSSCIYLGGNNSNNRFTIDAVDVEHQVIYSNASSLYIDRLTCVNVQKVIDIRPNSRCYAKNVRAYGVTGAMALVTGGVGWMGDELNYGELWLDDSSIWGCSPTTYGLVNHGKFHYKNLLLHSDYPINNQSGHPDWITGVNLITKPTSEPMPTPPDLPELTEKRRMGVWLPITSVETMYGHSYTSDPALFAKDYFYTKPYFAAIMISVDQTSRLYWANYGWSQWLKKLCDIGDTDGFVVILDIGWTVDLEADWTYISNALDIIGVHPSLIVGMDCEHMKFSIAYPRNHSNLVATISRYMSMVKGKGISWGAHYYPTAFSGLLSNAELASFGLWTTHTNYPFEGDVTELGAGTDPSIYLGMSAGIWNSAATAIWSRTTLQNVFNYWKALPSQVRQYGILCGYLDVDNTPTYLDADFRSLIEEIFNKGGYPDLVTMPEPITPTPSTFVKKVLMGTGFIIDLLLGIITLR